MALSRVKQHRTERWTCDPEGVVRDKETKVEVRAEDVSIDTTEDGDPYGVNLLTGDLYEGEHLESLFRLFILTGQVNEWKKILEKERKLVEEEQYKREQQTQKEIGRKRVSNQKKPATTETKKERPRTVERERTNRMDAKENCDSRPKKTRRERTNRMDAKENRDSRSKKIYRKVDRYERASKSKSLVERDEV